MLERFSKAKRRLSLLLGILSMLAYAMSSVLWGGFSYAAETETAGKSVTVKITNGVLRGTMHPGAMSFKGVPYGANTSGANRFKSPQPVENWTGIRDATTYGEISPQIMYSQADNEGALLLGWNKQSEPVKMGEDCLVLNVFTPDMAMSLS